MLTLINKKNGHEFFTTERCHISELLNDPLSPQLSVARCRVEPGVRTQLHALKETEETYLIECGIGEMDDGNGSKHRVGAGDAVMIPAGHPQRIQNFGTEDLVFVVICKPRFEPKCYINLEQEGGGEV